MGSVFNDRQAAGFLGISCQTLRNWRTERKGPAYSKVGRRVVYSEVDLLDYLRRNRIEPEKGRGQREDRV